MRVRPELGPHDEHAQLVARDVEVERIAKVGRDALVVAAPGARRVLALGERPAALEAQVLGVGHHACPIGARTCGEETFFCPSAPGAVGGACPALIAASATGCRSLCLFASAARCWFTCCMMMAVNCAGSPVIVSCFT